MSEFRYLKTRAQVAACIGQLNASREYVVLDTETTSKDPLKAKLVDVQLSGTGGVDAVMFPAEYADELKRLTPLLVLHNYKYDFKVLHRHGVDIYDKDVVDTMFMHYLVDENASHALDSIYEELTGESSKGDFWQRYDNYLDAPFEERFEYACNDILATDLVYQHLRGKISDEFRPINTHNEAIESIA